MFYFFNSNFFVAIATLIVGGFAICLYLKQKKDYKRDAANIILMEIRHAEKEIEQIKLNIVKSFNAIKLLLPTNNWAKYNYLFIKDFDRDELDLINNFYNRCSAIDNALSQMSISKQIEQKTGYIQNALVEMAKSCLSQADFDNKKKLFLKIIEKEKYVFHPSAPISIIVQGLNNLVTITTSTVGNKLKKIAKISN